MFYGSTGPEIRDIEVSEAMSSSGAARRRP